MFKRRKLTDQDGPGDAVVVQASRRFDNSRVIALRQDDGSATLSRALDEAVDDVHYWVCMSPPLMPATTFGFFIASRREGFVPAPGSG